MDWTTVFTCVMTSITTIAVAILGLYQSKKSKEDADYRRLKDQLEEERQKKIEEEKRMEEKRLESLEASVKDMRNEVQTLKEDMTDITTKNLASIQEQLAHLHILQAGSLNYMESLSNVVLMIGETLDDSDSVSTGDKRKIEESIGNHRKVESEIRNKLYTIIA